MTKARGALGRSARRRAGALSDGCLRQGRHRCACGVRGVLDRPRGRGHRVQAVRYGLFPQHPLRRRREPARHRPEGRRGARRRLAPAQGRGGPARDPARRRLRTHVPQGRAGARRDHRICRRRRTASTAKTSRASSTRSSTRSPATPGRASSTSKAAGRSKGRRPISRPASTRRSCARPPMTPPRPSEDDLIARYFAPHRGEGRPRAQGRRGAASPRGPASTSSLTADALVADSHFLADDPAGSIARKALGVNVSDLAAKGADPVGFRPVAGAPGRLDGGLARSLRARGSARRRDCACPLLGGDTVRATGALTLSITALGQVPPGRMVRRTAAKPGDVLCVTGTIGDAALGLALREGPALGRALSDDARAFLPTATCIRSPGSPLAAALRDHARAAMDVSDGLAGDLAKMMRGKRHHRRGRPRERPPLGRPRGRSRRRAGPPRSSSSPAATTTRSSAPSLPRSSRRLQARPPRRMGPP